MIGYLQDENGDLMVQNGDFVRGDVKPDIVADTLNYMPGDNKAAPELGVGLRLAMGGKPDVMFPGRLKGQCKAQGIEVKKITINGDDIQVEI